LVFEKLFWYNIDRKEGKDMGTVLLIDDDKEFRTKFRKLLSDNDINVLEAPDALEVVNVLMRDKSSIDAIVLDLEIKEVDGRDIYDIVQDYAPGIPVIVSSVIPLNDQKLKIPRARDYYNKAEPEKVLIKKIRMILGIMNSAGK